MEHEVARAELRREIERAQRHVHGPLPVEGAVRGEFVGVRRVDHHLDGRGEVVVDAGAGEKPALEGIPDAGQLGDGHPVGEFDVCEPEIHDFLNHLLAVRVAAVVPAG